LSKEVVDKAQEILSAMNGQHGILGCLLIASDGGLIASSLPAEIDTAMIAALCSTLFSNNSVSIRRMNRGELAQMTLVTERGILHFYQVANAVLVVLTARGHKVSLEGLLRLVEEQGQTLHQLVQTN
jgi:predicted regulator of Ras-like GTPase activity (Roadblock/LC7/MglB family)